MTQPAVCTHGHAEPVLRSHRSRAAQDSAAYVLPHLRAGLSLPDVGCGPGTVTADLAELVAPGTVTALEMTEEALDGARVEAAQRSLSGITFRIGDVQNLDLPDDIFDIVHAHQVLQHVGDPVQALRELRRVCRRADSWRYETLTMPASPGGQQFLSSTSGWRSTVRRPEPTAANRMSVVNCCPGLRRQDFLTALPRRAPGVMRPVRSAIGGRTCGRTGSLVRPSLSSW